MLCDQLVAFTKNPVGIVPVLQVAYEEASRRVMQAPRFILQRDAVMMVHTAAESTPSRLLSALNLCRLPFPSMWVEFEFRHRMDWMVDAAKRGLRVDHHPDSSPPVHLGFLLERDEGNDRLISVLPVWKHGFSEHVSICHLSLKIDTRPDAPMPSEAEQAKVREFISSEATTKRWARDPREVEAGVLLNARIDEDIPPYLAPMWSALLDRDRRGADRMLEMARFDLKMEWRFVLGLLVALNSQNLFRYSDEETFERLNKSRMKVGKPPLLSHREIRLSLSRVQRNRIGQGGSRAQAVAHPVRGHFKLRRSGVFWWSDHDRGGVVEGGTRTYRVDA